jgi:hypothetical protein
MITDKTHTDTNKQIQTDTNKQIQTYKQTHLL